METLYESEVTARGGVHGHVTSAGGALDLDTFAPSGVRDNEHEKTNPEQLFAASYASCLDATIHHIAEAKQLDLKNASIKAKVRAMQIEKGDLRFALDLEVNLPDIPLDKGEKLLEEGFANCPLSKATNGKMEVNVKLVKA